MLSREQNELLTRTDPGTPCGKLMRQYWQPIALAEELKPSEPLPVRILGENLVLFKDDQGRIGVVQRRCPHRGADLSYGRVEDGGLRCIYHGWLFGVNGNCMAQPGEPASRSFADRLRITAYPCREIGGLILVYMGGGDPPPLPNYPFFQEDQDQRVWTTKMLHECNYLQASEGNVDPQHLSYLHRFLVDENAILPALNRMLMADVAPELDVKPTGFGLELMAIRKLPTGDRYVRITNFVMPNCSAFDGVPVADASAETITDNMGYQLHWHVPIDDYSHWKYTVIFRYRGKMDRSFQARQHENIGKDFRTPANSANRYLQDRNEMASKSYAGMGRKYYDHDKFATECQGVIADRTQEHLGLTDRGVVAMRRQLLKAIEDLEAGKKPPLVRAEEPDPLSTLRVWVGTLKADEPLESWKAKAEGRLAQPA
jgi:phenylpropionate dioxygenase-like ring-hydroxylating dioxygenase large terminal subunit